MRFVALGDCNTGHESQYNENDHKPMCHHYWADYVEYELWPNVTLISRGNSGEGLKEMWSRWKTDVLDEKPDVVVIFGGINDFTAGICDPNPFRQEIIMNMVRSARENRIAPVLVSSQPFKGATAWTEEKQIWLDEFNRWLEGYAIIQSVVFIDAYMLLEDPGTDIIAEGLHAGTYYHLSGKECGGHQRIGKAIAARLREIK